MSNQLSAELINKFESQSFNKESTMKNSISDNSIDMIEYNDYNNAEKILQIGCGVVGSANIKGYKHHGFDVVGLDVIPSVIEKMNKEGIETKHPKDDLSMWQDLSIILISVPTPLNKETKKLDMKYIWTTIPTVIQMIEQSNKEMIIVMRSTVPVGLTNKYERKIGYELSKINCNKKFYVAFQPEFLRAVSAEDDAKNPWKVLFGFKYGDNIVKERMSNALLKFVNGNKNDLKIMSLEEAELHKYIHNYYNAMKISFSNSMYGLINAINDTEQIDMDAQRIMDIVATTSEGYLNPRYGIRVGAPYGGTCLSKDPMSLITLSKEYDVDDRIYTFLNGTEEVNHWIDENKDIQVDMEFSPNLMSFDKMKR